MAPDDAHIPIAFRLCFGVTNNEVEYEACVIGLQATIKLKNRNIKEGNLVLIQIRAPIFDPREKFKPNWAGPTLSKTIMPGGEIKLMDPDGNEVFEPSNLDQVKGSYP